MELLHVQAPLDTDTDEISSVFSSPFLSNLAEPHSDTLMEPMELPPAAPATDVADAMDAVNDAAVLTIPCTLCEAVFKSKRSLATHMRKHGPQPVSSERPFSCMFCSMTFTRASSMKKHMERVHRAPDTETLIVSSDPVADPVAEPVAEPVMAQFSFEFPVTNVTAAAQDNNNNNNDDVQMGEQEYVEHAPTPVPSLPGMTPMQAMQFNLSSLDMELERPPSMHEQMLMLRAQNDQLITQNELLTTQLNRFFDFFMHRNQ